MNKQTEDLILRALGDTKVRFMHLRNTQGKPYATVVSATLNGKTYIAASSCHRKDQFSKAVGRAVSIRRLVYVIAEDRGLVPKRTNFMTTVMNGEKLIETASVATHYVTQGDKRIPTKALYVTVKDPVEV